MRLKENRHFLTQTENSLMKTMADRVAGAEKKRSVEADLKGDDTPAKRLKQGRLPFKPLGSKQRTPVNNSSSKKRKLSGQDSPNSKAKQPKLPDLRSPSEKGKPASLNEDNEVSSTSSSETEQLSLNSKSKTPKGNLLDKFVRREDEISSTNEVIDLTESGHESSHDENSPVKAKSPRKSVPKSPLPELETQSKDKSESHFSRKLIFQKETTKTEIKKDEVAEESASSCEKEKESAHVPMEECVIDLSDKDDTSKIEEEYSVQTDKEAVPETNEKSPNSSICETSGSDLTTPQKEHGDGSVSGNNTPTSKGSSSSACTPQTPASANTSCNSIDGTTQDSSKKKRSVSKKQLEKALLRHKVKEEKEKQKQEAKEQKERERLEKKQKRDEEKAEKELAKKEEKEKKEKERLEKKEQADKEKQLKLQQKEEEKQKKLEQLNVKLEEKRVKEEEKRQKEEQKQKEEEEKQRQAQKRKAAFTSFFVKPKTVTTAKVSKVEDNLFIPFELKKDMTLAPLRRRSLSEEDKQQLDKALYTEKVDMMYLDELKQGKKAVRTNRVLRKKKEIEQEVELLVHDSETVKKVMHAVKVLKFHTDYRPPYYGTWRKKVKGISPRNPWKKDEEAFDYEVDSDDEWEEEEPGESLSDSNGEEEEGEEEDDGDDDGWMVPHGYLSEDEGCEIDEDVTPEVLKARQRAKAQAWEAELKAKKKMLPPLHLGCFWLDSPCENAQHLSIFKDFEMVCLRASPIETLLSCPTMCDTMTDKPIDKPSKKTSPASKGFRKRAVPEEAMPDLIRLVHGNISGIKKLVREFRLYWKQKCSDVNMSLDESRTEEDESKALDDSAVDTSVVLGESGSPANLDSTGNVAHEPMQTEPADKTKELPEKKPEPMQTELGNEAKEEKLPEDKQDESISKENTNDSGVSKRQLEIKILAIAVREKREGKKQCWYVNEGILKKYNMTELSTENTWVYVSGDPTKKTPTQSSDKKTPTHSVKKKTPKSRDSDKTTEVISEVDNSTTPHKDKGAASTDTTPKPGKSKKETSAKKTPKDQPSIMAFAKKSTAGEKKKPSENKLFKNLSTENTKKNTSTVDEETEVKIEGLKPANSQQSDEMDDCIILD